MFLPSNYEAPKSNSSYMKFQDGVNKLRVLSSAIVGYEYWTQDNKPVRIKEYPKVQPADLRMEDDGRPTKIKHFWAFTVWNYAEEKMQILEVTQATIQKGIMSLVNDEDWGDPKQYDLKITKTGKKLDTDYTIGTGPGKTELPIEIATEFTMNEPNLNALFSGEDPFAPKNEEEVDLSKINV